MFWLWLVGCASDPNQLLLDENNYSYTNTIDIQVTPAAPATDVLADWSTLDTDLQLHAVDPANDIDNVFLISFPGIPEEELEGYIAADTLTQGMTEVIATFENTDNRTSASLSEFLIFGTNPFDPATYFLDKTGYWLLRLTTGLNNTRMAKFLQIEDSGPDSVSISSTCATLDFQADIQSSVYVEARAKDLVSLDWSQVTLDGAGELFNPLTINRMILARYETATVADLEAQFFDIELIADGEWETTVSGGSTSVELANLTNVADGSAFPGLEAGLYLVALQNTLGTNPAPLYLAVLDLR